ncbi:CobD/CbiB family cobalamin biosynthesis protein [Halorubrum vacuolatum]|uniref:Probable cobalamin biosynthesis protein CobD n=1 Tax=Halorubrum vacuolatum TaxID=63740 RepID=A0A238XUW0_HALVU|nr:CobD/CbiB family cobalamin biosynthesis protein [Halorubrum vacuolatum]SNR62338.1 adenosylcobinamide-phosphate synthase [Halorubrum vacuolatum]
MSLAAGGAVALAAALDRTLAEPPARVHPVAWLGRVVAALDTRLPDSRMSGIFLTLTLPVAFALALALPVAVIGAIAPIPWGFTAVLAGVALFVCSSHRMLIAEATAVVSLSVDDPAAARHRLRSLAGRDPTALCPEQIRSAAVESAAENLADGLLAPYLAFAVGVIVAGALAVSTHVALAAGVAGAGLMKGINTLDSMLGYHDRRTGWAPARADDVAMWIPARVAAGTIALVSGPRAAAAVIGRAGASAREPSSPNSGWPMATVASAGRMRLEKPGAYTLFPEHPLPTPGAAMAGVRLVSRAAWVGVAGVASVVVILT